MSTIYPRARVATASMAVQADGNSLTFSTGASSASFGWVGQAAGMAPLSGSGITVGNRSVAGQSIVTDAGAGTMTARAAAQVDANYVAGKINVLTVWEFTNELKANGNNVTTAHNGLKAYCLARKAAAAAAGRQLRIIVATCAPAGADPTGGGQAAIDARCNAMIAANALVRAQYRDYADVLCDIAAVEPFRTMFAGGVFTNTVFINTGLYARSDAVPDDYTHFGNTGYALIARCFSHALKRVRR